MDQSAVTEVSVEDLLNNLLDLAQPLDPLELPLLDAHGATLAEDVFLGDRKVLSRRQRDSFHPHWTGRLAWP